VPAKKPVRVRQHVNPLSQRYRAPFHPPDWATVFAAPQQPLHLDIGSARGRFALGMAQEYPDWNFLGIEIREPLVVESRSRQQAAGLTNLHFLFCSINTALPTLLRSLPVGVLQAVSVQFPDPWFKTRHAKRRVVQPPLVAQLAEYLAPGGCVYLQSDVLFVAQEMRDRFAAHPQFALTSADWLPENPLPVQTEREAVCASQGKPIYRCTVRRASEE